MSIESGLNDSLNRLSEFSSSEMARVNVKRPAKGKPGAESARKLLGSILDDSAAAAEEERRRLEETRRRAEEEERRKKEEEEEMARLEAERAIIAEQQAQEDLKMQQAKMQAQLQREKDIEAGIINLEEEARIAREAEAKKRAEEEAKRKKAQDRRDAIDLKKTQENELAALKQEELARKSMPALSKMPIFAAAAAVIAVIAGVAAFFLLAQKHVEPYALMGGEDYALRRVVFTKENPEYFTMDVSVVEQEKPKPVADSNRKPGKRPSSGKTPAKPNTPAQPSNKPGLIGGGGLLRH